MKRLALVMFAALVTLSACNLASEAEPTPMQIATVESTAVLGASPTADNTIPTTSPQLSPTVNPGGCVLRSEWPIYIVQSGNTLTSIADFTGSTVDELVLANCLAQPDSIIVNQGLYVPSVPGGGSGLPTETYTSSQYGFAFDYPVGWTVQDVQGLPAGGVSATSFESTTNDDEKFWTVDMAEVRFLYIPPELAADTLDTWVAQEKQEMLAGGLELYTEGVKTLDSGLPAYRLQMFSGSGHSIDITYIIVNGNHIQVNLRGNIGLAESVLNTVRPA